MKFILWNQKNICDLAELVGGRDILATMGGFSDNTVKNWCLGISHPKNKKSGHQLSRKSRHKLNRIARRVRFGISLEKLKEKGLEEERDAMLERLRMLREGKD